MAEIHQCPFCELKYPAKWELKLHLDSDHPGRITEKDRYGNVIIEEDDPSNPRPL